MLIRALVTAAQDAAGHWVRRVVLFGLAGLAGLVAIGFLSAALYLYLRYWYGGFLASIWLAVIYGVIAVIGAAMAVSSRAPAFQRRAERVVAAETEQRVAQAKAALHGAEQALRSGGRHALKSVTPTGLLAAGLAIGFAAARWLRGR